MCSCLCFCAMPCLSLLLAASCLVLSRSHHAFRPCYAPELGRADQDCGCAAPVKQNMLGKISATTQTLEEMCASWNVCDLE